MHQKMTRHVLTSVLLASLAVLTIGAAARGQMGAPGGAIGSPSGALAGATGSTSGSGGGSVPGSYGGVGATASGSFGSSGALTPGAPGDAGTSGAAGTSATMPGGSLNGGTPSLRSGTEGTTVPAVVGEVLSGTGISPAQAAGMAKSVTPAELNA